MVLLKPTQRSFEQETWLLSAQFFSKSTNCIITSGILSYRYLFSFARTCHFLRLAKVTEVVELLSIEFYGFIWFFWFLDDIIILEENELEASQMGLFNKMMTKIKKEVSSQSFELFSQSGGLRPLFCSNKFYKQPLALAGWWVFLAFSAALILLGT